ncbi:glycosyl hydrolase family 18 protein [Brevibacillus sp. SYSU BS000544]|uniref:glycosyl hydrolase family 18 protein n=1 Tax=Brevibacillus sp. SYSU BS000544 TaxID=3416443 RepID=UPI003CE463A3
MNKKVWCNVLVAALLASACSMGKTDGNPKMNSSTNHSAPQHSIQGSDGARIAATRSSARIHVVQPGQSLYKIAKQYGLSTKSIAAVNKLTSPTRLVVGQTIVIPSNRGMRAAAIEPGHQTVQTRAKRAGYQIDVNAYIEPRGHVTPRQTQTIREISPYLTYLAPFNFQIKRDGTLAHPPLANMPVIARQNHAISMMVVTNLENDQFSPELGSLIVRNEQFSNKVLDNIIRTAKQLGFKDIHFDIEHIKPEDRDAFNRFLEKSARRIKSSGFLFSTALAPKTSASQKGAWYTSHDYRKHGQLADFVVIMTYEWGFSGGPPMPVSPLPEVRKVLEYARTEIPAAKIMMGQNLYGYDWTLPFKPGGKYAKALSPQEAIDLAKRENVSIQYDWKAQAPYFSYVDDAGKNHMVWFEDARSIQAKYDLIKELGLKGISYWKLGLDFPQNWLLLTENFNVAKRE